MLLLSTSLSAEIDSPVEPLELLLLLRARVCVCVRVCVRESVCVCECARACWEGQTTRRA